MSIREKTSECAAMKRPAGDAVATPRTAPDPSATRNSNRGSVAARSVQPPVRARYSPRKKLLLGTLKRSGMPISGNGPCAPHLLQQLDGIAVRNSLVNSQNFLEALLQERHFLDAGSGAQ